MGNNSSIGDGDLWEMGEYFLENVVPKIKAHLRRKLLSIKLSWVIGSCVGLSNKARQHEHSVCAFDCIKSNVIIARVTPKISIDQANVVALNS